MDNFLVLNIHNLGSTSENRDPDRAGTNATVFSQQLSFEKIYPSSEEIKIEPAEYFQCG
jgi:hypothetical protein